MLRAMLALILVGATAHAEVSLHERHRASDERRTLVYVEGFGKGGLYGVGIERLLAGRLSLGLAASYSEVHDQQIVTVAPYVHATLLRRGRHALFAELGLAFVHSRVPSPVPSWSGMSESGMGGFAALGYEWAGERFVVRGSLYASVGEGGAAPWCGLTVGVKL